MTCTVRPVVRRTPIESPSGSAVHPTGVGVRCGCATVTGADETQVRQCLETFYHRQPFVRMLPAGRFPDTLHVKGTNFCDIGLSIDPGSGRLILMSAIDNLVKGAAGQAVENMNLMFGFEETAGLFNVPFPL